GSNATLARVASAPWLHDPIAPNDRLPATRGVQPAPRHGDVAVSPRERDFLRVATAKARRRNPLPMKPPAQRSTRRRLDAADSSAKAFPWNRRAARESARP